MTVHKTARHCERSGLYVWLCGEAICIVFIRFLIKQTASYLAVTVKREARFLSRGSFADALEDDRQGKTCGRGDVREGIACVKDDHTLSPRSAGARPRVDVCLKINISMEFIN